MDYIDYTGDETYLWTISNTFEKNEKNNFLNNYYDDEGWWALSWLRAYILTNDTKYLNMSKIIFDDIKNGWDNHCGGGVWWNKFKKYKNAIPNELFLSLSSGLYLATNDANYLNWALKEWEWFNSSGMINNNFLINDG